MKIRINMDEKIDRRGEKTLDFIEQDKIMPENPWFYSRLITRMEQEIKAARTVPSFLLFSHRLRPVLAGLLILVTLAGGLVLGRLLTLRSHSEESVSLTSPVEEDATAAVFREISANSDEQILLLK